MSEKIEKPRDTGRPIRKINIGGTEFDIIDEKAPIQHVDVLLEVGHFQGSVHISFGAFVSDLGSKGHVEPVCRLRMSPTTVQNFRAALDALIGDSIKPVVPKNQRN